MRVDLFGAAAIDAFHRLIEDPDVPAKVPSPDDPENPPEFEAWLQEVDGWWEQWTCSLCAHWKPIDNETGECHGPELRCGVTSYDSMCEQWYPIKVEGGDG